MPPLTNKTKTKKVPTGGTELGPYQIWEWGGGGGVQGQSYPPWCFIIIKIRVTGEIRGRALHLCRYNVYGSASGFIYDFALIIVHSWHFSLKEPYWTLPMCLNLFYGFTRPWSECWLLVSQNHNKI